MRGLNAPPRSADRARFLDGVGDLQQLVLAFDAARAGDHADFLAAHSDISLPLGRKQRNDRSLLLHFPRCHLVRREDRHDFVDAVDGFQGRAVLEPVIADDGYDGSLGSDDHVFFQSHFPHQFDDVLDLTGRSSRVS